MFLTILKRFVAVVNSKFLYNTVGFVLLKDALLAGPRMGAASRNACVYLFSKQNMKVVQSKLLYSMVGFASLKDASHLLIFASRHNSKL